MLLNRLLNKPTPRKAARSPSYEYHPGNASIVALDGKR